MKNLLTILLCFFCWNISFAQTSIHTEIISSFQPENHYLLKVGEAKRITVKKINNPNDNRLVDEWIYDFETKKKVNGKLYRDNSLITTRAFELDSINRVISNNTNFKHKALGWERTIIKYVYGTSSKELQFLDNNGKIKYRMLVQFNDMNLPIRITSFNSFGEIDGLSIADYDYEKGVFRYVVSKSDGSIVLDKIEYLNPNYLLERNDHGDISEMFWPTAKIGSNVVHKLEYKYDKLGNWIRLKKIMVTPESKKTLAIITRKIDYINIK